MGALTGSDGVAGSGEVRLHSASGGGGCPSQALRATLQRHQMVGSGSRRDVIPSLRAGHQEAAWEDRHCLLISEDPSSSPATPSAAYVASSSKDGSVRGLGHDRGPLRAHPHRAHTVSHLSPWGGDGASTSSASGPAPSKSGGS